MICILRLDKASGLTEREIRCSVAPLSATGAGKCSTALHAKIQILGIRRCCTVG